MMFTMMNITRLGMMLAVSACAIPIWAMNSVEHTKADKAAWKAAWCRGVQHLPPAATPFLVGEAMMTPATLKMPSWGGVPGDSLSVSLFAETPFLGFEESLSQTLLTER
jgi:hypothetical protein